MQAGYISEIFVSFQGEGAHAGRRHLFIRLAGCNLRCRYCDTPGSLEKVEEFRVFNSTGREHVGTNPVRVPEILSCTAPLLASDGPVDGVALTGGEPLLQSDFLAQLLASDALPRPRLLETNGMLPDRLPTVLPWVDVVSMDIKIPSNTGEREFWSAHARFLQMARGKVYVKILVDAATAISEVETAAALVEETAPETPLFLQPITGPQGGVMVDPNLLADAYRVVRRRLAEVRVLPQTHKMLGIP